MEDLEAMTKEELIQELVKARITEAQLKKGYEVKGDGSVILKNIFLCLLQFVAGESGFCMSYFLPQNSRSIFSLAIRLLQYTKLNSPFICISSTSKTARSFLLFATGS